MVIELLVDLSLFNHRFAEICCRPAYSWVCDEGHASPPHALGSSLPLLVDAVGGLLLNSERLELAGRHELFF